MPDGLVGEAVTRLEDAELLVGAARYVDDISPAGLLHAAFVRSAFGHARLGAVDCDVARDMPGVVAVYAVDDLMDVLTTDRVPETFPPPQPREEFGPYVLARDEVCYVGEPVAVVIAENRYQAEDAAAMVMVDYDPLDAVTDCREAARDGAPPADTRNKGNVFSAVSMGYGDCDGAFAGAAHVISETLHQHRGVAMSMECRGVVASFDPRRKKITMWASCQQPHGHKAILVDLLGLSEDQVRVVIPHLGGGFGPKLNFYPEDGAVAAASMKLGKPVKWIEDRREHFVSTTTQRDQHWHLEVACTSEGKMLGLRGTVTHENGAYIPYGILLPNSSLMPLPGAYAIPAVDVGVDIVFTNTVPNSPVRGAGRPCGIYAVERMVQTVSRELGIPPEEVRRRNYVRPEQMPYETGATLRGGAPLVYDSGNYEALLDKALDLADFAGFKERQAAARKEGRYLGIGISSCIEDTGMGPYEGTTVRVESSGKVAVRTGAASQGQGHHTMIAMIVAENLGVSPEDILFESADTGKFPHGVGTIGSRVAANVGPSAFDAATKVREKALRLAAEVLEASEADLDIEDGVVRVNGAPDLSVTLGELAVKLSPASALRVPAGFDPLLEATSYDGSSGSPIACGSNVAEVEVDPGTGEVRVLRYSVAHDCGVMINPMIVHGQIVGGVIHGIGNALFERMIYDDQGQPLTTNYGEYLLPLASEMPRVDVTHMETPSPLNSLGVKGAGEGGTIPAAPAVVAAIENALEEFNVVIDYYPVGPQYLCELIDKGAAQAAE